MKSQGWFPFRLTGLISLVSKGLSSIFSGTRAQKHQFWYKYRQCNIWGYTKKKSHFLIRNLKLTECLDVYLLNLTPHSPFLAMPCDLWDLSSPTRDWTRDPAVKMPSPNHWTIRELPDLPLMKPQPMEFVSILRGSQARNRKWYHRWFTILVSPRSSGEWICFDDWLINTSFVSEDQSLGDRNSSTTQEFH